MIGIKQERGRQACMHDGLTDGQPAQTPTILSCIGRAVSQLLEGAGPLPLVGLPILA
jgi:hypothetical protein